MGFRGEKGGEGEGEKEREESTTHSIINNAFRCLCYLQQRACQHMPLLVPKQLLVFVPETGQ